ncbi:MAG TPA: SRPBCC family protein [Bacteroidia bacterium]|nr:SRPBCC family protein [Bacteroidia bacterium]
MSSPVSITVRTVISAPVSRVWECFTQPQHITRWNFAVPEWHCPAAENDLRPGGKFSWRMEAKDGSFGFDFAGTYTDVRPNELIAYTIGDGRKVHVTFMTDGDSTEVTETFEAESQNPVEMQRGGWQAILDNFRKHAEAG